MKYENFILFKLFIRLAKIHFSIVDNTFYKIYINDKTIKNQLKTYKIFINIT